MKAEAPLVAFEFDDMVALERGRRILDEQFDALEFGMHTVTTRNETRCVLSVTAAGTGTASVDELRSRLKSGLPEGEQVREFPINRLKVRGGAVPR